MATLDPYILGRLSDVSSVHPKLAAATTLSKLGQAVAPLGLHSTLALPMAELIERAPDRAATKPLLASLARRFHLETLGDLIGHQEAHRWLSKNAALESEELISFVRGLL